MVVNYLSSMKMQISYIWRTVPAFSLKQLCTTLPCAHPKGSTAHSVVVVVIHSLQKWNQLSQQMVWILPMCTLKQQTKNGRWHSSLPQHEGKAGKYLLLAPGRTVPNVCFQRGYKVITWSTLNFSQVNNLQYLTQGSHSTRQCDFCFLLVSWSNSFFFS